MNTRAYCLIAIGFLLLWLQYDKLKETIKPKWWVDSNKVRKDYPVIENLSQWLIGEVPHINPEHPEYIKFWSRETKRCIEGKWGKEFGKYRYMPGNLYFFGNYGIIKHTWQENGVNITKFTKPLIMDYIWEFAYMSYVAYGFSGFEKDDKYTCNLKVKQYLEGKTLLKYVPKECFNGDVLKEYVDPYKYISSLKDSNLGRPLFQNEARDVLVMGCLGKNVGVRMFDGTVKKSQDVLVGDLLMGIDSTPRTVTELVRGKRPMFTVQSKYGESFKCTDAHRLYLKKSTQNKSSHLDVDLGSHLENINMFNDKSSYEAVQSEGIEYPEANQVLHPYFIGLWLGDGFKREKLISFNPEETEIKDWFEWYSNVDSNVSFNIKDEGEHDSHLGTKPMQRIRLIHKDLMYKNNWWSKTFRNNKHIPQEYLIASKEQRLELLAGMIDSDGHYDGRRYTITGVDLELLKQFQEVARSLGLKAIIHKPSITGTTNSLKYNLRITGNITIIPCKLKRKQATRNTKSSGKCKNNIEIITEGVEDFYGFEIDGDHLYLLEDYTVTHNSRRGGKSYWVAIGELEYNFVFSGARRYDEAFLNKEYNCAQCVGSADTDKSSDLLSKFKDSQDCKTNIDNKDFIKWFGLWQEEGYDNKGKPTTLITPCPFYKRSMGNLDCPNKKTPYISKYKIQLNGQFVPKGDGNEIFHVNYSEKKGTGSQAAVGNTYLFSDVEENGLVSNVLEIKSANDAATKRGVKIGVQWFQGTSGNIDYVQASKKMFLSPQDYNFISFKNEFSLQGKNNETCYFIPKYIILPAFKDENGNTDYEAALTFVNNERQEAANSAEPAVLSRLLMNEPNYVDEMWITDKGYYLPYEEASVRHRELTLHQHYKELMTPVELVWDKAITCGVKYNILHDVEPIVEYPLPKNLKDPSGCIVIYEFPQTINGIIPQDMYCFIGHDPYIEEAIDRGGSLGVTYILKNPKYIPFGYTGNIIVASYIGKPVKGIEYYYEQQEKLVQFYGNPSQGLWYEKNRGENVRAYYTAKNKLQVLAPTPQYQQGSHMFQRHIQSFGYLVSSNKRILINMVKDWLLQETEFMLNGQSEKMLNIQRIPCLFLINQIMQYNEEPNANFDAVMAFVGCILGLREYESGLAQEMNNRPQVNRFKSILENHHIFKNNDETIRQSKRRAVV